MPAMRVLVILPLVIASLGAAGRPRDWRAINYGPRGHPYFRNHQR